MKLDRLTEQLALALFVTGGAMLLLVFGLALVNMAMRALGQPLRGMVEISGYLGAAAMGLCLPWVQRQAGHVEGGLLHQRLSRPCRLVQRSLTALASMVFMVVVTLELAELGWFVHEGMERIDGWDFGYAGLVGALALGCAVQALVLGCDLIGLVNMTIRGGSHVA